MQQFGEFQLELDAKHDKHERLVKLSRDVTIDSKRAIFQLQRIPGSRSDEHETILHHVRYKLDEIINNKFFIVAKELVEEDAFQFLRAYSPGLQEYIEAESLYHYLKDGTLVTHAQIKALLDFTSDKPERECKKADHGRKIDEKSKNIKMSDSNNKECDQADVIQSHDILDTNAQKSVPETACSIQQTSCKQIFVTVPLVEYILGICDLTGEVMRLAITHVSTGDLTRPFELCGFLRDIYNVFTSLGFVNREFCKKVSVIQQSLMKVENACYNLQVRGSEVPKHMLVDMFSSQSYSEVLEDPQ